jgi:hypothetical protein
MKLGDFRKAARARTPSAYDLESLARPPKDERDQDPNVLCELSNESSLAPSINEKASMLEKLNTLKRLGMDKHGDVAKALGIESIEVLLKSGVLKPAALPGQIVYHANGSRLVQIKQFHIRPHDSVLVLDVWDGSRNSFTNAPVVYGITADGTYRAKTTLCPFCKGEGFVGGGGLRGFRGPRLPCEKCKELGRVVE